ncbi:uncharacterized protein FRV6_15748 [Fusarium oxysporum]|uniref:Uncharacterized protein n=1 Tax=Fusarium oxysporum TaxID=5507 RepID=A0A2H3U3T0_FUSOX|nr:uncharacterized protein FRV6_15748 [Fusarium oxysporum]
METLGMTDPSKFTDIVEHYQVGKLLTTGTCTVLAIRTATAFDYANRGVYNFLMSTNKSGHRFSKGFMKWFLEGDDKGADSGLFSRYLFMAADLKAGEDNDKEKIWRIVWREGLPDYQDKVGTAATNNHCRQQMRIFVGKFGPVDNGDMINAAVFTIGSGTLWWNSMDIRFWKGVRVPTESDAELAYQG